jgi:hypothetical protein
MLKDIVDAYHQANFDGCLQFAVDDMLANQGIETLHIAGLALLQLRRVEEGMTLLRAAAAFQPQAAEIYTNAANAAQTLCLPDDLEYFCRLGLRAFPTDPLLKELAGNVHLLRLDYQQAVVSYQELLAADPHNVRARINLANAYRFLLRPKQATEQFELAGALAPEHPDLIMSLAAFYGEVGRPDEAMALLEQIDHPDAPAMLALHQLACGDYANGWNTNQRRWSSVAFSKATLPPRPVRSLQQVDRKQVAIMREGGFGDVFQFFRYIQMLAWRVTEIHFTVRPSEVELYRYNLPNNINFNVVADPTAIEIPARYEHTIALFDLPLLFETFSLDAIPATLPYLRVPADAVEQYALAPTQNKRVGLVWAGGAATGLNERAYDRRRSIKLGDLACLGEVPGVDLISLQQGPHRDDIGLAATQVLSDDASWLETAAVLAQLDLVISVDTAVVHLAAAMGRPTWLLSRFDPCWRWLRNRPDSPWYPGVLRVFGQTAFNDWSAAIEAVRDALTSWSQDLS